jgi:hypothetical protein
MCAAIPLKLCTWLYTYMYDLQIKFEDGCYQPLFRKVMPLQEFYSISDFFSLCLHIFIWYLVHCFAIWRYRSSLSLVLIHWFFTKLWPLDLEKNNELSVLSTFFPIFIWYLVHWFTIPRYRLSLSLALIHWFFTKLWPLDLAKKSLFISFSNFFPSLLTDIHLIFGTLLFHTKIQIKFEFGFHPLIFHEVMAHRLRKISPIISFPDFSSLCLHIFIQYLVHCFAILSCRSSSSVGFIH